ncbi:MAG: hypothetical protein U1F06_10395 [Steroidobacteraceae bacterium]
MDRTHPILVPRWRALVTLLPVMGAETLVAQVEADGGLSLRGTPFSKSFPYRQPRGS